MRGVRKPLFIHFNLNYHWLTYENVPFQISAKTHHKLNEEFDFCGAMGATKVGTT